MRVGLIVHRDATAIAVNFADEPVSSRCDGDLLLTTDDGVHAEDGGLFLPAHSAAIVTKRAGGHPAP